ncbi:hypothetical protein MKW94_004989 [Papaver nudicaule]|uniref:Uncharacterized protein n=1 Tax=Papaver nudicaule TaxID=74823 RepID=A0AA41RY88_PAPNU|nr:hypothetical protein [Papaver nudicaule]
MTHNHHCKTLTTAKIPILIIMASSYQRPIMTGMFICLFLVLLQQHCYLASARKLELRTSVAAGIPKISTLMSIKSFPLPTIEADQQTFPVIHPSKKIKDAFRPTSPGHSPGVGHGEPPSGHN